MSHYYKEDQNLKEEQELIQIPFEGKNYQLLSNTGVFSKDKLDTGTRILLENILASHPDWKRVCDLGCGIGVVGVFLHETLPDAFFLGIDTNERACRMARENYARYKVQGEILCQDGLTENDGEFDGVVLNPPIRTGKETIYRLFAQAADHLSAAGELWIVIRKQHGAASAVNYLENELHLNTERVGRDKGFWVLKCTRA